MVTRIAILGGGAAALGVAYELTSVPGWEQRFSIDLYQIGWRLGGKCASGRDLDHRGRNHEHGLHVLGGFYHNTFQQLQPLYAEWATHSPKTAIRFEEAFHKHSTFSLMRPTKKKWRPMRVHAPEDKRIPGVHPELLTPWAMLKRILAWIGGTFTRALLRDEARLIPDPDKARMSELAHRFGAVSERMRDAPFDTPETNILDLTTAGQTLLERLAEEPSLSGADWIGVLELVITIARGFVADQLPLRGYDGINRFEATEWLRRHGGSKRAIACPLFTAGYSYGFAFPDGGPDRDIAAGCGMRGWLRMVFGSHGSMFVHMNGGMGEVFVVPYYEVLKARGVRFHFFHRVEELTPGNDGRLAAIKMRVQATPTKGSDQYEPLVDYDPGGGKAKRRCWPTTPAKDQLDGALPADPTVLESWVHGAGVGNTTVTLEVDREFDLCVLGLSIGTLREVAAPLAAAEPRWRRMLEQATTCPTIAAQIWREEPVSTFKGWSEDHLMTGYARALDTWCDMSFLIPFEQRSDAGTVASLSYFCGPFPANKTKADPDTEVEGWLQEHAARAFPGLDDGKGGYRHAGELERYARLNTDPIDLHVDTPAGTVDARLRPDGSGFANLLLAGDWTRNNFDVGCVETAILSARICARAICGEPQQIYGESDFH